MLIRNIIILFCVECIVDSVSIHSFKESESSNVKGRPSVQPVNVADYKDLHKFKREKRKVEIIRVEVIELKIVESTDADSFTSLSDANSKLSLYDRYGYYTAPSIHGNEDQESLYDVENLGNHRFEAMTPNTRLHYQNSVDLNQMSLIPTHDTSYFYPSPPHKHHNEIFSPNLSHDSHQHSPPGYHYHLPSRLPLSCDDKNNSKTIDPLCKTDTSESNKVSDSLLNNEKSQLTPTEDNSTVIDYSPSSPEVQIDIRFNVP